MITRADRYTDVDIETIGDAVNVGLVVYGCSEREADSAQHAFLQTVAHGELHGDEFRMMLENCVLLCTGIFDHMTEAHDWTPDQNVMNLVGISADHMLDAFRGIPNGEPT